MFPEKKERTINMSKRILIVGGVAGGASAAARIRRLDEMADITIFERGPHVSFSNCCLPYYLSRTVAEAQRLIMMTPERFKKQYNIDVRTGSEVIAVNPQKKTITVRKADDGEEYKEAYDKLVLSPGGAPILPKIEGIDRENVFTVRNVVDIQKLDEYLQTHEVQEVAVIGGGFIGCEVAENLIHAGRKTTLIEAADQIMAPFDYDMVQTLHKEMMDHGVELILGDGIAAIREGQVVTASGKTVPAQAVVMAIGVRPETTLAKAAGLEIGETGGIKVNGNYQTSDPDIYAVGDAIEVTNEQTGKAMRLALAWPAQMEARAAADHICGLDSRKLGFIGSSVVRIFDLYAASTGLNEKTAKAAGINYDFVYLLANDRVALMPGNSVMYFKLLFEVPTGKILGAQAIGKGAADRRVDIIAAMIKMHGTLEDLKDLELCYAPVVSTAKDVTNMAAMVGLNVLQGRFRQVKVSEVRNLVESGACIVDVREPNEFAAGHLKTAVNIPLSQLRERTGEIPHDVPVYLHCRSSQRSYNAIMALQQLGFDNLYNISGSFLGISLYEYPQDTLQGREPIVTAYNFR